MILSFLFVVLLAVILGSLIRPLNSAIVLIYLGIIWMICDLISWLVRKLIHPEKKELNPEKSKEKEKPVAKAGKPYIAGIVAIILTVVYMAVGWYQAYHVWEKDYTIETEKEVGSLRIVQFADSHLGTTFHGEGFEKLVEKMQAANPDVVVLTGDFVDDASTKEDMIACCAALGKFETKYGVYYSFGNHDKGYYGNEHRGFSGDDLIQELEKNNVIVLQDETVLIDDRFYIIGRQDRSEDQRGNERASMQELTRSLDAGKFQIVLDHQPNDYQAQEDAEVDLVLSGHTHGGQLFPINNVGVWIKANDKTYGHEKRNKTDFIVTSGISDWEVKFKTGCRSEFVVIDIV